MDVVVRPDGAVRGARRVENRLSRIQGRADAARASLTRMVGVLAGGAAIGGIVRTLANFDRAIQTAGTIARASAEDFQALSDRARELGATTRFTATDAANGLTELSRAGFSVDESLTAVGDALTLAQAGNIGLQQASLTTARAVRTFGLAADQAGDIADVLTVAANSSTQTVGDLAAAFQFAGPAAASAGLDIRDTAAALSVLADQGLAGTLGGTGLRQVLVALLAPSNEALEVFNSLGIAFDDVNPAVVGLQAALERLRAEGLDAANGAFEVFPARAGSAFLALTANAGALDEARDRLDGIGGAAQTTATQLDDNLEGSLRRVASAFEAVLLSAGEGGATGGLRGLLDNIADGLRALAGNIDPLLNTVRNLAILLGPTVLIRSIRALTAVVVANPLGALAVAISTVIALVPDLQTSFNSLVEDIQFLGGVILESLDFEAAAQSVAGFIDATLGLFSGFGAALGALFDAIGQQPKVVGELIVKGFRDAIETTLDFFFAFAQTVGNIFIGLGQDIVAILENLGGAAGALSVGNLEAASAFSENIETALLRSANRVATFTGQVEGNFKRLQDVELLPEVELSQEARDLGNVVSQEFQRGLQEGGGGAQQLVNDLFNSSAPGRRDAAADAGQQAADQVVVESRDPSRFISGTSETPGLSAEQNDILNRLSTGEINADEAAASLDRFSEKSKEVATSFADDFNQAFGEINTAAQDFGNAARNIFDTFADRATDAITKFVETGEFNFKEFANALIKDIQRIIIRLLVVRALNAVAGAAGLGGVAATAADQGIQQAQARQDGGPVQPDQPFLVGEAGPELFVPDRAGSIVSNQDLQQSQAPAPVNVTVTPPMVVNVQSEDEIPDAINSGASDDAIINALQRNRDKVQQVFG